MIRTCLAAAIALFLAACSQGPDDTTASYTLAGGTGTMVVKAASNGDARVDAGGQTLIRHGDTEYLVGKDAAGEFAAKVPDFIAVMGEMLRERGVKPVGLGQQPEYELVKQGTEKVADIEGDVWKVHAKNASATAEADAVVSGDPAYANVAKAFAMHTRLGMASIAQVQGGEGNVEKKIDELLGKGLVLRFGPALRLSKIERAPIDAASFALPKTVLDKAALKARLVPKTAPVPAPAASPTPSNTK